MGGLKGQSQRHEGALRLLKSVIGRRNDVRQSRRVPGAGERSLEFLRGQSWQWVGMGGQ